MHDERRLLAIAHQFGGAQAIAPVIRELERVGGRVSVRSSTVAQPVFARAGIDAVIAADTDDGPGVLDVARPSAVLAGTSAGRTLEKAVVREARARGVPTVGVLDNWSNYAVRFADDDAAWAYLPDMLAVMDEESRAALVALGCPVQQLRVTGHPHFDDLPAAFRDEPEDDVRRRCKADGNALLAVFVSEPQHRDSAGSLPYDEVEALQVLISALAAAPQAWTLVVRPHPTEPATALEAAISRAGFAMLAPDVRPRALVAAADLVVGMTSLLLLEAAALGPAVISLQPRLDPAADTFIGNKLGVARAAYTEAACRDLAASVDLHGRGERARRAWQLLGIDGRAAARVAALVRELT